MKKEEENQVTVFICGRGNLRHKGKKIQLEVKESTLEHFKERAKEFDSGRYTAKQIMENILNNEAEGVQAG